ncbi:MAG: hypothetical protein QOE17_1347 [Gaiellales bacterium]|nr:hypothetical protein [Gaiellales bacterium]
MYLKTLLVAFTLTVTLASAAGGADGGAIVFTSSGLGGGGFQNVIAIDPSGSGLVLAGGDTSGVYRSTDWGTTWQPANTGLTDTSQFKIATIEFSPTVPGRVYAGAGNAGSGGGLLVSDDDGVTWTVRSAVPQFAGGDTPGVSGLPPSHPRSTGHLLAIDPQGTIYAATFAGGVKRSSDGGLTWTTLGLAGQHLRSIALDPDDANVVIVSSYEGGVFRTVDAGGTGGFTAVAGAPTRVEELRFIGSDLYAAGADGLDVSHDAGSAWQALAAPPTPGALWTSIDGHQACGATFVVAGSESGGSDSVVSSSDAGASWTALAGDPSTLHTTIADAAGDRWWLADQTAYMLGGDHYTSAMVADAGAPVDGCGSRALFVTGRSGIWRSVDDGGDWYPVVAGLGVTINPAVAADPSDPGRVGIASSDWGFLVSLDGGGHVVQRRAGKQGFDAAADPTRPPGAALLATGNESTNKLGELWSSPDPATTAWVSEGLGAAAAGRRPLAVAANLVGGKRVLLAAVDASGIWRREGTAAWARVSATAMATKQAYSAASLVWPFGSSTAYLYDHRTGVWRSSDSGRTWVRIWSKKAAGKLVGYVAVDPARLSRLWVSAADGVYRLDGAGSGTVGNGILKAVRVLSTFRPGPLAIQPDGSLLVAVPASTSAPASLLRTVDGGVAWQDVSDPIYRATGGYATDLAVGPDGLVYVSTFGDGVLVGHL